MWSPALDGKQLVHGYSVCPDRIDISSAKWITFVVCLL